MARILIIDDEDDLRATLRQMLEQDGHEVSETANGAHGLELYEKDSPDLIMPKKEGVETIIALHRSAPNLPIIAISGGGRLSAGDFLSMVKKLGAQQTLRKSFRRTELLTAVRDCLEEPPPRLTG